jgi:hypothetical protein
MEKASLQSERHTIQDRVNNLMLIRGSRVKHTLGFPE